MQTRDLEIFVTVAASHSLSGAARRLGTGPMQISRRIAALEAELDARLFHRTTRALSLTAEGAAFLPYATAMLETEEQARGALVQREEHAEGLLRLTAPSVFGQEMAVPLLAPLLAAHPALSVELDLSDGMIDMAGQGYDLAIRLATMRDSDLVARRLAGNPRVLCAAPAYLARQGIPRLLADLERHDCIRLTAVPRWPFVIGGMLTRHALLPGRIAVTSVEAARKVALEGGGIAMLTFWDVQRQLATGDLVQIRLEDAAMEDLAIWAVMPTRRFVPSRVKLFLAALETALGSAFGGLDDTPAG